MTPSQLKYNVELANTEKHFFERGTMKFFGDTMSNFGCRSTEIKGYNGEVVECWELYRKRPVKNGLKSSHYFNKATFKKVFPIDGE
jgi:hypothetical protein